MPIRRLPDFVRYTGPGQPCLNTDHDPPKHIVLEPGLYEHSCPGCGAKTTFYVDARFHQG